VRVGLLFPDGRDWVPAPLARDDPALIQDLDLETVATAMGNGDAFLHTAARNALLARDEADAATIRFRQEVMQDALAHPDAIRGLYSLAVDADERRRRGSFGYFTRSAGTRLWASVALLQALLDVLRHTLRSADRDECTSRGLRDMLGTIRTELGGPYLDDVARHLEQLEFRRGVLLSARLGPRLEGVDYAVRRANGGLARRLQRTLGRSSRRLTFRIDDRDEAGARALSELKDRAIRDVALAAEEAATHVTGFFEQLRRELAFYVGSLNLHDRLTRLGCAVCWPNPVPGPEAAWSLQGLRDIGLVLRTGTPVVPNDLDADGRRLLIVTGANQGGKSSFLRALGVAQIMMRAGMFVAAERYEAVPPRGVFTHFRREEDATLTVGKFDEELSRLDAIVDQLRPGSLVLLNESFAATNEREGSEVARQIVTTLPERGITVVFVTHLHEFARTLFDEHRDDTLFLRAERLADGTRTFRVRPGAPLETSYAPDLYHEIFGRPGDGAN